MPGFRLCLGGTCHHQFVAVTGDEIGAHLDLVLLRPGIDLLLHDIVTGRHPVIPETDGELAGSACSADVHQRQCRCSGAQFQSATARNLLRLDHSTFSHR